MTDYFIFALEILGTIAFAISGAMVAINKKMDIFGVMMLGLVTATGGGVIRDLVLGITPPATFQDPVYALTAMGVSAFTFIPWVRKEAGAVQKLFDEGLLLVDSLGLGIFTVVAIETAYTKDPSSKVFLLLFVGTITGVGGGIMRDLLVGQTPFVFVKHFYATASLIGGAACVLCWKLNMGSVLSTTIGAAVTTILRLLAAHYKWHLPKAE